MDKNNKIDWLNHALEFVVVVVGILLAFQLNQWAEDRKEQAQVNKHLVNIAAEAEFNQAQLETAIRRLQQNTQAVERILAQLKQGQNTEIINEELLKLLNVNVFYLNTSAFSTLKESGDIRLIQNFELKNQIVNLYEYYRAVKSLEEGDYNFRFNFLYPYALENLDLIDGTPQNIEHYDNQSLKNIVGSLKYIMTSRVERYQQALSFTRAFIEETETSS